VTDKHTFVQVDSQGNKINMWRGSNNITDIKSKINSDIVTVNEEKIMDKTSEVVEEVMMKKEGMFIEYSAEKVAATSGNKVLFFHANWCPSCIGAAKNLSAATAPEGLNVFKVDYDSSADLKAKYGVVSQHTFVQIDDNGTMVKRWFGSRNYEDILTQLQ
jgi:thiol-disulfide isomerase/thioredoxin